MVWVVGVVVVVRVVGVVGVVGMVSFTKTSSDCDDAKGGDEDSLTSRGRYYQAPQSSTSVLTSVSLHLCLPSH